jgi:NAD-dependent deacetylase
MWTKYDPDEFTYRKFLTDPEARRKHWRMLTKSSSMMTDAKPNLAHHAIAELEKLGKLDCVITQNVDGLHQKAGNSEDKVIQLHGNMSRARCLSCGKLYPMDEVREWLKQGVEVTECPECHGILKPDAVFFGEAMPVWETTEAEHRSRNCDLCIVVGSSLVVYPAAFMPMYAAQSGAKLVIINQVTTQLDGSADVCIHAKAGEALSQVMERVRERLAQGN